MTANYPDWLLAYGRKAVSLILNAYEGDFQTTALASFPEAMAANSPVLGDRFTLMLHNTAPYMRGNLSLDARRWLGEVALAFDAAQNGQPIPHVSKPDREWAIHSREAE